MEGVVGKEEEAGPNFGRYLHDCRGYRSADIHPQDFTVPYPRSNTEGNCSSTENVSYTKSTPAFNSQIVIQREF